jgi:hypothetical protein
VQLLRDFPRPQFGHFHSWLSEFIDHEWSGGYPSRVGRLGELGDHRLRLDEAAKLLRCRTHDVALLLKNGLVRGSLQPLGLDGRIKGLVTHESVMDLVNSRGAALPLVEIGRRTGLSLPLLRELCLLRFLQADRGPTAEGETQIAIDPRKVEDFLHCLEEHLTSPLQATVPVTMLTPNVAARALGEALKGTRTVYIRRERSLVVEVRVGERSCQEDDTDAFPDEGISLETARNLLGICMPLLHLLAQHNLLSVHGNVVFGCPAFRSEYVWELDAARLAGVTTRTLRRWVQWGRIFPAYTFGKAKLFRRAELLPFTPENRCTIREAAEMLGLRYVQEVHRRFIRTQQLEPLGGPGVDDGRETILSRIAVMALVSEQGWEQVMGDRSELTDGAVVAAAVSDAHQTVTTCEAAQMLGLTPAQFHSRYRRTGAVQPCGRQPGGGQSLYRLTAIRALATEARRHVWP